MFSALQSQFSNIMDKIKSRRLLSEDDVHNFCQEIKISLLEADVSLNAVKYIINYIKENAQKKRKMSKILPSQIMLKMVKDKMIEILSIGESNEKILKDEINRISKERSKINLKNGDCLMLSGLQGNGKTTSAIKIAKYLSKKFKPMLVSTDIYRPAAREQLKILSHNEGFAIYEGGTSAEEIISGAIEKFRASDCNILIIDTAGRSQIDSNLMNEIKQIHEIAKPRESILVIDSMIGQEAVNIVKGFQNHINLTGIFLSKTDGDSRGGSAFSVAFESKIPIKLLGNGEKSDDVEEFHGERIIQRILGEGDMLSLAEKTMNIADEQELKTAEQKFKSGQFDLNDMRKYMGYLSKLGGLGKIMSFIPGMNKISENQFQEGKSTLKKIDAILSSMKEVERKNPKSLTEKRKSLITRGSGTTIKDLNDLLKKHKQMQTLMKQMGSMQSSSGLVNSMKKNLFKR